MIYKSLKQLSRSNSSCCSKHLQIFFLILNKELQTTHNLQILTILKRNVYRYVFIYQASIINCQVN